MRRVNPEVTLLIVLGLGVGLLLAGDYGNSWDEHLHKVYAEDTIEMYLGQRLPGDTIIDLRFYGPAFSVAWLLARNMLGGLIHGLKLSAAGHFVYWLAFIPAPILVYSLARRVASRKAALASALLFATQPLIFGHAFVNPKDTPFMTALLGSVWAGLWASDLLASGGPQPSLRSLLRELGLYCKHLGARWSAAPARSKAVLGVLWFCLAAAAVDSLTTHLVLDQATSLIRNAHAGQAAWPMQALFDWVAQDAWKTPLAVYLEKTRTLYLWTRIPFAMAGTALLALLTSRVLGLPLSMAAVGRTRSYWSWGVAAVTLGLCSAIRVFGPFAGALVSAYVLLRAKRRAWLPLTAYGCLAVLTLYAAWPFLWRSPLQHFADAVFLMAKFPWGGRVLYEGGAYAVTELPWEYVPRLLSFQLTLPALALGLAGILLALVAIVRRRPDADFLFLLVVWFLAPLAVVVLLDVQIYAAFRQLMFVFPAFFVLTAIVFDKIFYALRVRVWPALFAGLVLAPGLIGIALLHPYEMIYYNELIGGVAGAAGRFGLDHWGTTYREAIEFIGEVAPRDSLVLVGTREYHTMTPFAREDLRLAELTADQDLSQYPGAFIVDGYREGGFPQAEVVYRVVREGVTLSTVIRLPAGDS